MRKLPLHRAAILIPGMIIALLLTACKKQPVKDPVVNPEAAEVTSIFPLAAKGGETITVYGKNLLTDTAGFEVTVNARKALVSQFTNDSIKAVVPLKAGSGKVVVKTAARTYNGMDFSYSYDVIVTTIAGTGEQGNSDGAGIYASFKCPWGITADDNGDLFIADCYNRLIRKISGTTGLVSTMLIPNAIRFYSPYNLTLDKRSKSLYVTDFNSHLMKVDGSSGALSTIFEDAMPLAGIALSPDDHLYVGNNTTGEIFRIDTTGANKIRFATGLITPRNIVFDKTNTMYIAGPGVYKMNADGSYPPPLRDNAFGGWEIAIDTTGTIYEADHFNNNIRMITPDGSITTIAGSGNAVDEDGIGMEASFNGPQGLCIDKQGNLYVTTYNYQTAGGNKVRKITFR